MYILTHDTDSFCTNFFHHVADSHLFWNIHILLDCEYLCKFIFLWIYITYKMEPDQKSVLSVKYRKRYCTSDSIYISFFHYVCIFAFWNLINAKVRSLHATFIRHSCHVWFCFVKFWYFSTTFCISTAMDKWKIKNCCTMNFNIFRTILILYTVLVTVILCILYIIFLRCSYQI